MTATRDPNRLISDFLREGIDELPEGSFDAVRAQIDHTRQRVVFGPWREDQMRRYAIFGIAAAAIVLVAVIGIQLLPSNGGIGGQPTPSASASPTRAPTASPSPSPSPSPRALTQNGPLAAGGYVFTRTGATRVPVAFTVPAGWASSDGQMIIKAGPGIDASNSSVVYAVWIVDSVYRDACHWQDNLATNLRTRDAIVEALASQTSRDVTEPTTADVGGMGAVNLQMSVSADFDVTTCDQGLMRSWPDAGPNEQYGWPTIPGEVQDVYVLDSTKGPMIIFTATRSNATSADKQELAAILESTAVDNR